MMSRARYLLWSAVLLFALSAVTGYVFFRAERLSRVLTEPGELRGRFQQFIKTHPKTWGEIDLASLPQASVDRTLVDPNEVLPTSYRYRPSDLRALLQFSETCRTPAGGLSVAPTLRKVLLWQQYLCGQRPLPSDFFTRKPFVHPSGASYVALALRTGETRFSNPVWVVANFRYIHAAEVPFLLENYRFVLPSVALSFRELGRETVLRLLNADGIVPSNAIYYLDEADYAARVDGRKYLRVPEKAFNRFLQQTGLKLGPRLGGELCSPGLSMNGSLCLRPDLMLIGKERYRSRLLLILSAILLVLFAASAFISIFRRMIKERSARLFMLKVLTHELRTPATSVRISLEAFRKKFDELPVDLQDAFLQICEDSQRLRRLIDASSQYLKSSVEKRELSFSMQNLPSINTFINQVLEPYEEKIKFGELEGDRSLRTDPYWLGICIVNLVENALQHGAPPVRLSLWEKRNRIAIEVSDAGRLELDRNGQIIPPASKVTGRLGFGLEITRRILSGIQGELTCSKNPTRFRMELKVI